MEQHRENRKHPRFAVSFRSEIESALVKRHGLAPECVVRNVSDGGVFIETGVPFKTGDLVPFSIRIPPDDREVKVFGRARWRSAADPRGIGVRFEQCPGLPDLLKRIETYIEAQAEAS